MDLEIQNQALSDISRSIFGDRVEFRIVEPKSLVLLKQNARYFKKETFKQLVDNIKKDRRLSSVPLCHRLEDGALEVLSGNHRVQAAVEAKIEQIMIMVILEDLSKSERIAIQLSHNALVGEDDAGILGDLWAQIEDIQQRLYAGLSSDAMQEIEDIKMVTFSTPSIATRAVTFLFTEHEMGLLDQVLSELDQVSAKKIVAHPVEQFEPFFKRLQQLKDQKDIKNGSLAMVKFLEYMDQFIAEG